MGVISYRNRNAGKKDKNGKTKKPNWEYRFEGAKIAGKRTSFTKSGFDTKQECVRAATLAHEEYITSGSVFEATNMSYSDCIDSWLENYVAIRCNESTQYNYRKRMDFLIRPVLGKYALAALRRETIQNFMNSLVKKEYSRNSLVNVLGMLTSSLRYAKRQGWIANNPADDIDLPQGRQCAKLRKVEREPVPREIMEKIFERFPEGHPAHLPYMLAYHCGLRIGEVYGLSWDDIDLEAGELEVRQQIQWSDQKYSWCLVPPKYDSCRRVKLDNEIWGLLKRERQRHIAGKITHGAEYNHLYVDEDDKLNTEGHGREVDLVLTREDGTYIQSRTTDHYNKVVRKELGWQKFDFHSLRHTHATELCEIGVNIKEIQRRLGHSTMEVTSKRYLHATEQMELDSVELMNQMHGSVGPTGNGPGMLSIVR